MQIRLENYEDDVNDAERLLVIYPQGLGYALSTYGYCASTMSSSS